MAVTYYAPIDPQDLWEVLKTHNTFNTDTSVIVKKYLYGYGPTILKGPKEEKTLTEGEVI